MDYVAVIDKTWDSGSPGWRLRGRYCRMLDRNAKQALSFVVFVMFAALSCGQLLAQMSVTGAVSGTVLDASGSVVPGAAVKLRSETTRETRETKSNGEGLFSFTVVPRDSYTLKVEHAGFKAIERTGISVSANEHVALSGLTLELGSASSRRASAR